ITFYLFAPNVTPTSDGHGGYTNSAYSDTVTVSGTRGSEGPPKPYFSTTPGISTGSSLPTMAGNYQWVVVYSGDANNSSASTNTPTKTVPPAPLTITAGNATRIQGEANPAFSVSYSGWVNGEGPSALGGTLWFSTTATTSSPPGLYAILPG